MSERADRFFLYGYYGQGNVGDDLLLYATIEGVRQISPNASFVIRNEGAIKGLDAFGGDIHLTGIDRILSDQSRTKFRRGLDTMLAYRRSFRECGWFVLGGGTVFHERSSIGPLVLLASICLLARLVGLRVVALGVGISKLKSVPARIVLRLIVSISDLFTVRDEAGFAECAKAGVTTHAERTDDLAFSLVPVFANIDRPVLEVARNRRIGISIYPPALSDAVTGQARFEALQEALALLLQRDWDVSLMTFHDDPERPRTDQDHGVLAKLAAGFSPSQNRLISQDVVSADPASIARAFSAIDLHCGMRFHGHVLAAIFDVPFVGISVDNKINGICELFGMPVLEIKDLSGESIVDSIDRALALKIDTQLRDISVASSQENFSKFSKLYWTRIGQAGGHYNKAKISND